MKEKHSNSYYLDKAPVHKSIMHLSIPMILGMSAGTLYNLINAFLSVWFTIRECLAPLR